VLQSQCGKTPALPEPSVLLELYGVRACACAVTDLLTGEHLPLLLPAAGAISTGWAACQAAPQTTVPQPAAPQPAPQPLALP
jgi:hypothetical protein